MGLAWTVLWAALAGTSGPSDATVEHREVAARRASHIEFKVRPGSVLIFLDGAPLGAAKDVGKVETKPGRRKIRLTNGKDETELEVEVGRASTLRFEYEFDE